MAIYQYEIQLIPRKSIVTKYGQIPDHIIIMDLNDEQEIENNEVDSEIKDTWTFEWWKNENILFNISKDFLESFLNEIEWSKHYQGSKSYGNSDSNNISIEISEDEMIGGIYCRIDLSKADELFVTNILKLANQLDCLILDRKCSLFEPSFQSLVENIKNSNSFKFISNPSEFLGKLVTGQVRLE